METITTFTVTYDCPYRKVCSDNGVKCETCANNPKRSYYRPIEPYYSYPYWYTTPYGVSTTESHYQST